MKHINKHIFPNIISLIIQVTKGLFMSGNAHTQHIHSFICEYDMNMMKVIKPLLNTQTYIIFLLI